MPDALLSFDEVRIQTSRGPRGALLVAPTQRIVLGTSRLAQLRANLRKSAVDDQLLRAVRSSGGRVQILLFSAQGPGGASRLTAAGNWRPDPAARWQFDPALTSDEADDIGYLLTMSQLPTWRQLVLSGVQAHFHTDWGVAETGACRRGVARARRELEAKQDPVSRLDAWILSYLSFFFSATLDHVLAESLSDKLGIIEQKAARTAELIAALPAPARA